MTTAIFELLDGVALGWERAKANLIVRSEPSKIQIPTCILEQSPILDRMAYN